MGIIKKRNNHKEMDLLLLIRAMWKKAWLVIMLAVLCGGGLVSGVYFFEEPVYQAQISLYVNNTTGAADVSNITYNDISASYMLLETYATVIKSKSSLEDIIELSGTSYTTDELAEMIDIDAAENTAILLVGVRNSNPETAALLANAIAESAADSLPRIVTGSSVKILDNAEVPKERQSPSYTKAAAAGAAAGIFLSALIVIRLSTRRKKMRSKKDLNETGYPVLGRFKLQGGSDQNRTEYMNLKTNIMYSLPGKHCKKIVFTSSSPDENKSVVVMSLSRALVDEGYKVLMTDFDLRNPNLTEMLKMKDRKGVTEVLIGASDAEEAIRHYSERMNALPGGTLSMNPLNLLKSGGIETMLEQIENDYEYILMDASSFAYPEDILELCRYADGVVFTVKRKTAWKQDVESALEMMKTNNVTVLGMVGIE